MRYTITESELKHIIQQSVRNVLSEGTFKGKQGYTYNPGAFYKAMTNGVGKNNGAHNEVIFEYLGNQQTYLGQITKFAQNRNTNYPLLIEDLHKKIRNFLENGYFGEEQNTTEAVSAFLRLLEVMRAYYESQMSRVAKKMGLGESYLREGFFDWIKNQKNNLVYRNKNKYGIMQKVQYQGQDGETITDYKGQWILDLRKELETLLQYKCLHGPKTVEATRCLIEMLTVEKRGLFGGKWANRLKMALAGVAMLSSLIMADGAVQYNTQFPVPQEQTQVQQQTSYSVKMLKNTYELNSDSTLGLKQIASQGGSFIVEIHETENPSGKDASYEYQLMMLRAKTIAQSMDPTIKLTFAYGRINVGGKIAEGQGKNCSVVFVRGENVNGEWSNSKIVKQTQSGQQTRTNVKKGQLTQSQSRQQVKKRQTPQVGKQSRTMANNGQTEQTWGGQTNPNYTQTMTGGTNFSYV